MEATKDIIEVEHSEGIPECTPCAVKIVDGAMDYTECHWINNDHLGYDEKKNVVVIKEKPTDIIPLQNAYKEESDIHTIIKKAGILGVSLEATENDFYGDATLVSDSLNEQNAAMIQNAKDMQQVYAKLPKEVTGGLSLSEFLSALGNSDVHEYVKSKMKEETKDEK